MMEAFTLGGPLMWPLAICSVVLLAFLFERGMAVPTERWRRDMEVRTAHRRVLAFFTDVPPALGLLGTVIGVIECFHLLEGDAPAEGISGGLGVACITTVFGLGIALVASVAGHALDILAVRCEEA
jgi:biopolymer transport protein ExbB/TolQ